MSRENKTQPIRSRPSAVWNGVAEQMKELSARIEKSVAQSSGSNYTTWPTVEVTTDELVAINSLMKQMGQDPIAGFDLSPAYFSNLPVADQEKEARARATELLRVSKESLQELYVVRLGKQPKMNEADRHHPGGMLDHYEMTSAVMRAEMYPEDVRWNTQGVRPEGALQLGRYFLLGWRSKYIGRVTGELYGTAAKKVRSEEDKKEAMAQQIGQIVGKMCLDHRDGLRLHNIKEDREALGTNYLHTARSKW